MKHLFVVLMIAFPAGCNKHHPVDKRIDYEVTNVQLTDMGRILPHEFKFESFLHGDSLDCRIRTMKIKKNNTIASLDVYGENDVLYFGILTSPYDFDCSEDSCLTVHDVTFTVVGIKKGEYYVVLSINNETVHLSDVYPLSIK